jgi:hypothetical protein
MTLLGSIRNLAFSSLILMKQCLELFHTEPCTLI